MTHNNTADSESVRNLGTPIIRLGAVTSTMEIARQLERQLAPEGVTVVAASQSAGRGRAGRTWDSPASAGLYCSILLRPDVPVSQFQPFSIAAGLAICDALDPGHRIGLQLKWPNDILFRDRKLAGILVTTNISGSTVASAIVGFGLNLLQNASNPTGAISLSEISGVSPDRLQDPLPSILKAIGSRYAALTSGNPDRALDGWQERLAYAGRIVSVQDGGEQLVGIVAGLATDGALLLDTESDQMRVTSGDLVRGPRPVES